MITLLKLDNQSRFSGFRDLFTENRDNMNELYHSFEAKFILFN